MQNVTTSPEPVCVRPGLKAPIAKNDSVLRACTVSYVTSTALVTAATLWGKLQIHQMLLTWPEPEAKHLNLPPVAFE